MSIPYMPLYVADYEADTAHLTPEEDGIYMRLLRLCWRTPGCTLPDDDAWILRRLRVDDATFYRVAKPIICEFFQRAKGRVFSPRLLSEFNRIQETSAKRSAAGKMGGRPAKALKTNEANKSPAKANGKHLEPEPDLDITSSNEDVSLRPLDDISEAVAVYNDTASQAGWPQAQKMTPARRSALKARLRDCGGIDGWRDAMARAGASDFLTGRTPRPFTGCGFDWLTKQTNFTKLMEGNYDNRSGNHSHAPAPSFLDEIAAAARAR